MGPWQNHSCVAVPIVLLVHKLRWKEDAVWGPDLWRRRGRRGREVHVHSIKTRAESAYGFCA